MAVNAFGPTASRGPVLVLGEPLVAFVAEDGPLPSARRYTAHVTGAEANLATALARLGHRVAFLGRVGDDGLGRLIERTLRGEGIDISRLLRAEAAPTSVLIREPALRGPAEVLYHRAAGAGATLVPGDLVGGLVGDLPDEPDFFRAASCLYLSGVTPALSPGAYETTRAAAERAHAAGTPVVLDVNMRRRLWSEERARPALRTLLPYVSLLFGADDELAVLHDGDPHSAIAALHEIGVETVVRKTGAAGAEVHRRGDPTLDTDPDPAPVRMAPAASVPVRDTVGAGDAFAAGYLSALLDGATDPAACLRRAHELGAYAVTAVGDTAALPDRWRLTARDTQR